MYYPCSFRLDKVENYFIWVSDENDSVYVERNKVLIFNSMNGLQQFASLRQLTLLDDSPVLYDLDAIIQWTTQTAGEDVNGEEFLTFWNLCTDISQTLNRDFLGLIHEQTRNRVYEKLFDGLNLPQFTPPGQRYAPNFTQLEQEKLRDILLDGLRLFRESIADWVS
jgi:hypothetical protein